MSMETHEKKKHEKTIQPTELRCSSSPGAISAPVKNFSNAYKLCIFYSGNEGTKEKLDETLKKVLAGIGCSQKLVDLKTRLDADEIMTTLRMFTSEPQEFYIFIGGKFIGDLDQLEQLQAEGVAQQLIRDQRRPGERRQSHFSCPTFDNEFEGKGPPISPKAALNQAKQQQLDSPRAEAARIGKLAETSKLCVFYSGDKSIQEKLDRTLEKVLAGIDCSPKLINLRDVPDEDELVVSISAFRNRYQHFYVFVNGMFMGDIDQLEELYASKQLPSLLRHEMPVFDPDHTQTEEMTP